MSNRPDIGFSDTLHVRDHCLCLSVQRAARALARRFDEALRPLELTNGQFSLLMALNRPEPPSIGSVAELLAIDRTTLTANLKPLEKRGLLRIGVDEKDRRSRHLFLTDAGREKLTLALPIWKARHAEIDAVIGEAGTSMRQALAALL